MRRRRTGILMADRPPHHRTAQQPAGETDRSYGPPRPAPPATPPTRARLPAPDAPRPPHHRPPQHPDGDTDRSSGPPRRSPHASPPTRERLTAMEAPRPRPGVVPDTIA